MDERANTLVVSTYRIKKLNASYPPRRGDNAQKPHEESNQDVAPRRHSQGVGKIPTYGEKFAVQGFHGRE